MKLMTKQRPKVLGMIFVRVIVNIKCEYDLKAFLGTNQSFLSTIEIVRASNANLDFDFISFVDENLSIEGFAHKSSIFSVIFKLQVPCYSFEKDFIVY